MTDPFQTAEWISRAVPAGQRISRAVRRDRIDWVAPGGELAQTFDVQGRIRAVNVDIAGPDSESPWTDDVRCTLALETLDGSVVAERVLDGPQLVWGRFGQVLDVNPAIPAGTYRVTLRPDRGRIGWHTAGPDDGWVDDGVSPLPVVGEASANGTAVPGTRLVAVDTEPAPNPLLRCDVELRRPVRTATLHAAVLGCGFVRINGRQVAPDEFDLPVTDYDKTVLYRSYQVAHLLRAGRNEILIEAGRDRYAARGGDTWGWNVAPWHREPTALLQLSVTYADGTTAEFGTGADWQAAAGSVTERFYQGEDWVVGGDPPEWRPVAVVAPPKGTLRRADQPSPRRLAPIPAVTVRSVGEGGTVYDFGAVMTGRISCVVTGGPGGHVEVVSGEQVAGDGSVNCDNFLVAGPAQRDTLRLDAATERFVWEPRFGYRGFRWIQVRVCGDADVDQVRAVPIYTPLEEVGSFSCSDPVVEWIDTALARTFRNNLHGVPTDTPIYEKNGWTADAHLATEALLHHFDLRVPFGKWMDDHVDAQSASGAIPQIIPTPGWSPDSDPAWSSSAVLIPWYLYREYGDPAILERYAPMARRFADNLLHQLVGGIWRGRTWGDWLAPGHTIPPEGMKPIGTLMTITALHHTAAILSGVGDGRATRYADAAADTAAAYHGAYFDPSSGHYAVAGVGYRQSLNILPLAFNTVPSDHVESVQQSLIRDIEQRTGGHLDCGAVGIRHLLGVLSAAGRDDLALTVLTNPTRPGWGAWFRDGEKTLLESWDPDARSRNHYFLGSVDSWIQQRVGGLRSTTPGWTRFEVSPIKDDRLTHARISHRTPLGQASVQWERGPGGWQLEVTVPPGSHADVRVDDQSIGLEPGTHALRVSGRPPL